MSQAPSHPTPPAAASGSGPLAAPHAFGVPWGGRGNPRVAGRDEWKRVETLGRLVEFLR